MLNNVNVSVVNTGREISNGDFFMLIIRLKMVYIEILIFQSLIFL